MKLDVSKSIIIDAPITTVQPLINDFNQWPSWSPWSVLEPSCSFKVEGNPSEPNHTMAWDGEIIGSGKNTLIAINDNRYDYDLEFFKPWKSQTKVNFCLEAINDTTKVTWNMDSSFPIFLFFMLKRMKNLIGMDYVRGLKMLKEVAETGELKAKTEDNGMIEYQGFSYVGIQRTVSYQDMSASMQQDFDKIVNDVVIQGGKGAQHWLSIYPKFNMNTMEVTYIAAISDEDIEGIELDSSYIKGDIEDSKMLEIKHQGSYEFIGNAWSMGMMTLQAKKIKSKKHPFEQYWNNPKDVSPEELLSSVYFPVKS